MKDNENRPRSEQLKRRESVGYWVFALILPGFLAVLLSCSSSEPGEKNWAMNWSAEYNGEIDIGYAILTLDQRTDNDMELSGTWQFGDLNSEVIGDVEVRLEKDTPTSETYHGWIHYTENENETVRIIHRGTAEIKKRSDGCLTGKFQYDGQSGSYSAKIYRGGTNC